MNNSSSEREESLKSSEKPVIHNQGSAAAEASRCTDGENAENSVVYDGSEEKKADPENELRRGLRYFLNSLQFRIICVVIFAGLVSMIVLSMLTYSRISESAARFIDEELSQIASVVINYRMTIPKKWEAPRQYHAGRHYNMHRDINGNIVLIPGEERRMMRLKELMRKQEEWLLQEHNEEQNSVAQNHESTTQGAEQNPAEQGIQLGNSDPVTPSLIDITDNVYDITIAPLYGRPGDPLYIPPGVSDGFYTVLVADQRVRAFVTTNVTGQRFVVARPLSSLDSLIAESFFSTVTQFFFVVIIAIPLLIILAVNLMLRSLNRIALGLYKRSEDDLSPVIRQGSKEFIPSELDGFILSINRLFGRVDESMQMKRRFIADAAHEMRTQSTVLSLQISALDREDLSPQAREKADRLKAGIAREKELMTSLLTLAREQGSNRLNIETVNIFELYVSLIESQEEVADRKNIDLGIDGSADFNLLSDRTRLTGIMSNLLSNALKYTQEGGRVDLTAERLPDGALRLTVRDNGPGIPAECLKHITEPFYRVHGDRSEVQGTGLGLAIVKAGCDSLKASLRFSRVNPHGLSAEVTVRDVKITESGQ